MSGIFLAKIDVSALYSVLLNVISSVYVIYHCRGRGLSSNKNQCKMGLTGLHDSSTFLFDLSRASSSPLSLSFSSSESPCTSGTLLKLRFCNRAAIAPVSGVRTMSPTLGNWVQLHDTSSKASLGTDTMWSAGFSSGCIAAPVIPVVGWKSQITAIFVPSLSSVSSGATWYIKVWMLVVSPTLWSIRLHDLSCFANTVALEVR